MRGIDGIFGLAIAIALASISAGTVQGEDSTGDSRTQARSAESIADALQIAHRLIEPASEVFACYAPYDVAEPVHEDPQFVVRLYDTGKNCERMLAGLNTWGQLSGMRFVLALAADDEPESRASTASEAIPGSEPPASYDQTLIHEIDPEVPD